jgi:membrane associated rhomboid family serine protease
MSVSLIILLIVNGLVSWTGFSNQPFFKANMFHVDSILIRKEFKRLITSGFLHANTSHLLFNMLSFYFFAPTLVQELGDIAMVLIYFASLVGGNSLSLYMQKNNGDYSAIGASGAVSGIVFAAIAVVPGMKLYIFFIPVAIPAYIYGLFYMLYSINGIRKQADNIGHEAHLGGAVIGVLLAIAFMPSVLESNSLTISLILVPVLVFIAILLFKPRLLMVGQDYEENRNYDSQDDRYNLTKAQNQKKMDHLLDKINKKGLDSLSKKEKDFLEKYNN